MNKLNQLYDRQQNLELEDSAETFKQNICVQKVSANFRWKIYKTEIEKDTDTELETVTDTELETVTDTEIETDTDTDREAKKERARDT